MSTSHASHEFSSVEQALFHHEFKALIVALHENERPLHGLAGRIDWIFQGEISRFLAQGAIQGKLGELTLIPLKKNQHVYFIILMGLGKSENPGHRRPPPVHTLENLNTHLSSLKLEKVGVSRSDLGQLSAHDLKKHLSGAPLWIGH